jgi:hypothetical protein
VLPPSCETSARRGAHSSRQPQSWLTFNGSAKKMTTSSATKRGKLASAVSAILGASAGVWFWWALQLNWWFGLPLVLVAAGLIRTWVGLQLAPTDAPRRISAAPFVAASWICLLSPLIVTVLFFLVAPKSLPPPSEREAAAARAIQFVYPQAIAILFGLASFWGVRCWRPVGVLVRSGIGIGIACWSAYMFAMVAVGMKLWR